MTTNETSFFRDLHPFEALRKVILPELSAAPRAQKSLTIWSAASSTGQELYSIAFVLKDLAGRFPGWSVRLIGTDLSTDVLERARAGRYSQLEVNRGLPAPLLIKYFDKVGTDWQAGCIALGAALFSCAPAELDASMIDDSLRELLTMAARQIKSALSLDHALGLPRIVAEPELSKKSLQALREGVVLRSRGAVSRLIWIAVA